MASPQPTVKEQMVQIIDEQPEDSSFDEILRELADLALVGSHSICCDISALYPYPSGGVGDLDEGWFGAPRAGCSGAADGLPFAESEIGAGPRKRSGAARRMGLKRSGPDRGAPIRPVPQTSASPASAGPAPLSLILRPGPYSYRNATVGSTFVARRAGHQHATSATAASTSGITRNVPTSVALTP